MPLPFDTEGLPPSGRPLEIEPPEGLLLPLEGRLLETELPPPGRLLETELPLLGRLLEDEEETALPERRVPPLLPELT